ncbi:CHAT domain-containing protein [Marivirga sericea]|uniref:CHAT domain-containing protein n=1 Tax=Marivirga sericea TaxID=1028 RepID=A0A1X7IMJ5_9BACT|nr:CHAT domain-containing tetratricopeptide repeat protein [Marivirga sericea]SMG15880.1 CHAT domain-containing protein [Marivirga sericea]
MFRLFLLVSCFSVPFFGAGQILSKEYHATIFESRNENIDFIINNRLKDSTSNESKLLLAELYFLKGRNDKAIDFLDLLANDEGMEKHANPELYARWLKNRGLVLWNQGKSDQALEYLQQSLSNYRKLDQLSQNNIADLLNNMGLVHVGNSPNIAVRYYEDALRIYSTSASENLEKIIQVSINISLAEINQEHHINALRILNQALSEWSNNHKKGLPTEAFIKANIGGVYLATNQLVLAKDYLGEAEMIYLQNYGQRNSELANVYAQLSELELRLGSYDKSLFYIQKALKANSFEFESMEYEENPKVDDANKLNIQLSLLMRKAVIFESFYYGYSLKKLHLESAISAIDVAERVLEDSRAGTTNKKDLLQLSDLASELYEDGQRIALQLHEVTLFGNEYLKKAFQYAELSQSALLKTAVVESEAQSFAGIPEAVLEKEKELSSELAYLNTQISLASEISKLNLLRDRYFQLKQEYQKFIERIEVNYPTYYNLKHQDVPTSIADIQSKLKPGEAVIEYAMAPKSNQIIVYWISNSDLTYYRIYEQNEVLRFLRAYRNTLIYNLGGSFQTIAHNLYNYLFPFKIGKNITKLVIIPDGELATIPFEALVAGQDKQQLDFHELDYLIKSFDIHYSYSASLYQSVQTAQYGSDALLLTPVEFGQGIAKLSASEQESKHFRSWCNQQSIPIESLVRSNATKERFKNSTLEDFRFIHLATHGTVDLLSPDLSGIYFSNDINRPDENILYVGEIYGLSINAELVVLSACETGLGKINRGEGVMGLGQAFAYSGADNLILSLWKVADESTSLLMQSFYRGQFENEVHSFSNGLREAKLAMINSDYSAPYFWAPFVLWGK